ncbi:MAG: uracil-DNA glycosylase [Bacteroidetes bacterium]|nr:uracil-DNA glycosylase [Bacteroidota bacterium]MBK9799209.1 uracil-DNA glycosylase [Bacteroidota bacterium]MBP6413120.1 uracil-DNA glycosylase [Bacteroidia bacterium]
MSIEIEPTWKKVLQSEFEAHYFAQLKDFLIAERAQYKVFPKGSLIFNAFNTTSFHNVRVVIIGQDPYHGLGQANGLCFSVAPECKIPPSLQNIFKELRDDLGLPIPNNGNLESWAKQGVLLLNATLTVRENQAGSHQGKGWEVFTDAVIRALSEQREGIVFLLWGKFAQGKLPLIDTHKHFVLQAAHPSPFSAYNGFFGCKHFSKTNAILNQNNLPPINWEL